jgi:hypothetical protein
MINTLVDKVRGFLVTPVESFRQSKDDEPGIVFTCFTVLLLIHAILCALIVAVRVDTLPMFAGMSWGNVLPVMIFIMVLVGGFAVTLIFAAWLHLWVYLFGGRKGIMQTMKAVMYGSIPRLLLGWIPFIGFIFALWSLVLGILGVRELQEMSTTKAILAVAIAVMIPLILLLLIAAYFITTHMTTSAISSPPTNII